MRSNRFGGAGQGMIGTSIFDCRLWQMNGATVSCRLDREANARDIQNARTHRLTLTRRISTASTRLSPPYSMGGENRARGRSSDLGAAFRLSRRRDDGVLLVLADQTLREKVFRGVRDGGNILPVILPSATRSRAVTGRKLVDTASV